MDRKTLKEYLKNLDIPKEDKNFVLDFKDKNDYIIKLIENEEKKCGMSRFDFGYGNVDSNIAIVFSSLAMFYATQKSIERLLGHANCELWTVYVTFADKIDGGNGTSTELLYKELYAVSPSIIYYISDTSPAIEQFYKDNGKDAPKICVIKPELLIDEKNGDNLNKAWKQFRHVINYKNKTIR